MIGRATGAEGPRPWSTNRPRCAGTPTSAEPVPRRGRGVPPRPAASVRTPRRGGRTQPMPQYAGPRPRRAGVPSPRSLRRRRSPRAARPHPGPAGARAAHGDRPARWRHRRCRPIAGGPNPGATPQPRARSPLRGVRGCSVSCIHRSRGGRQKTLVQKRETAMFAAGEHRAADRSRPLAAARVRGDVSGLIDRTEGRSLGSPCDRPSAAAPKVAPLRRPGNTSTI